MENLYLEENVIMDNYVKSKAKKTRQGCSKNTKYGNKGSTKHYKKRYRGQGK